MGGYKVGVAGDLFAQIAGIDDYLALAAAADLEGLFLIYGVGHGAAHADVGEYLALIVHVNRLVAAGERLGNGDVVGSLYGIQRHAGQGIEVQIQLAGLKRHHGGVHIGDRHILQMGQIGLFAIVIVASLEFNILVFLPLGNYIRAGGNDALGSLSVVVAILFHGSLGEYAAILGVTHGRNTGSVCGGEVEYDSLCIHSLHVVQGLIQPGPVVALITDVLIGVLHVLCRDIGAVAELGVGVYMEGIGQAVLGNLPGVGKLAAELPVDLAQQGIIDLIEGLKVILRGNVLHVEVGDQAGGAVNDLAVVIDAGAGAAAVILAVAAAAASDQTQAHHQGEGQAEQLFCVFHLFSSKLCFLCITAIHITGRAGNILF